MRQEERAFVQQFVCLFVRCLPALLPEQVLFVKVVCVDPSSFAWQINLVETNRGVCTGFHLYSTRSFRKKAEPTSSFSLPLLPYYSLRKSTRDKPTFRGGRLLIPFPSLTTT